MTWTAFAVTFRLCTPLHVGWKRAGNTWHTRSYLPAVNLFKAAVARCTEEHIWPECGDNNNPYLRKQEWLQDNLLFTYFFPAIPQLNSASKYQVFIPGKYPKYLLDYLFLDCHGRTSLNNSTYTALDGGLHYMEYLSPHTRSLSGTELAEKNATWETAQSAPVFLRGYCFLKSPTPKHKSSAAENTVEEQVAKLKEVLHHIQVGGERSSGWGRLALAEHDGIKELGILPSAPCEGLGLFSEIDDSGKPFAMVSMIDGSPCIQVEQNDYGGYILAHLLGESGLPGITGRREQVYLRETISVDGSTRFGRRTRAIPCLAPGARVSSDDTINSSGIYFGIIPVNCIWEIHTKA